MGFDPPSDVVPTSDESELLLRYLQLQREFVAQSAVDLTEEQARWRPEGKLIAIIGVINHLTHVETRWIDGIYARQQVAPRSEDEFIVGPERTLAEIVEAYAARAVKTDRTVRSASAVTEPCLDPNGIGDIDLRWVLLHLIEETAHHAGHAESTREMLDGRQSGW
jgi:uncharacterized damage-inducible protein DinB